MQLSPMPRSHTYTYMLTEYYLYVHLSNVAQLSGHTRVSHYGL